MLRSLYGLFCCCFGIGLSVYGFLSVAYFLFCIVFFIYCVAVCNYFFVFVVLCCAVLMCVFFGCCICVLCAALWFFLDLGFVLGRVVLRVCGLCSCKGGMVFCVVLGGGLRRGSEGVGGQWWGLCLWICDVVWWFVWGCM